VSKDDQRSAGRHILAADAVRRWPAGTVLAVLGSVFALVAVSLVVLLAVDQRLVTDVVARLHDETVPWTLERQRLARNLEELRLGGQRVLTAPDLAARNDALFLVRVLAAHPGMGEDPRTAALAAEAEGFLAQSSARGPSAVDIKAWEGISARLRLLADDLSVEGGSGSAPSLTGCPKRWSRPATNSFSTWCWWAFSWPAPCPFCGAISFSPCRTSTAC